MREGLVNEDAFWRTGLISEGGLLEGGGLIKEVGLLEREA